MENIYLLEAQERMEKAIDAFSNNLTKVRTGRANSSMLNGIFVDYYGTPTPINQIASVSIQEGKTFMIKPYDRSSVKDIEKAINTSDLGLPVQNNGDVLRINVPGLTQDTRKAYCKQVDKMIEEGKVAIRNIRRETNDDIKKDKDIPEDFSKNFLEDVQKETDKAIAKIEKIGADKQKEIMTI